VRKRFPFRISPTSRCTPRTGRPRALGKASVIQIVAPCTVVVVAPSSSRKLPTPALCGEGQPLTGAPATPPVIPRVPSASIMKRRPHQVIDNDLDLGPRVPRRRSHLPLRQYKLPASPIRLLPHQSLVPLLLCERPLLRAIPFQGRSSTTAPISSNHPMSVHRIYSQRRLRKRNMPTVPVGPVPPVR
jgi:hypothetical protein